ncbi:oligopeptide ABC transporter substrate-binding protein OppA [Sodalis sp. CWE]|uniref:oligopeptide ABC transporter substrate-binding protein OppA n=1 Tax=Sodalis sp. CWE TaxID=2803816 RepID=UPI001C7DB6D3|nr:oligopeptide ABC transporter substrate-binding protein OppA [Sodalis sp. CWE]MBX4181170.1 oligopeptide ABC transporter substrate-binding protein OppA [Sodalis sp. CWE]
MTNIKKKIFSLIVVTALNTTVVTKRTFSADVPLNIQLSNRQELVRGNGAELQSLDPHKIEGMPEWNVNRDIFEGLVIYNLQGDIQPGVAKSWENKDFRIWTFHLRKNIKWSNGDPITAQDFVYSWQRLADPKTASPYESYLQYARIVNIDDIINGKKNPDTLGIKALDECTLEISLAEPVSYLIKILAHPSLSPLPKKVVEKFGDRWTRPKNLVSNGAYTVKDWIINEQIILERNQKYWNNDKTVINKVVYLPISSEISDVNRYRSGNNDMTYNSLPIELFQKLKKKIPEEIHTSPYLCTYYYEINNQRKPFTDIRVRTALKLGLDRDLIINRVKAQGDLAAYSLTPPYTEGAKLNAPEWFGWSQERRNKEGRRLLAAAGFTKEKPLTFNLLYNTSDLHKKLAIAVASIWRKNLGINVQLENKEWKTFLDTRHQGNFDIARAGWCADYNEPTSFLNIMQSNSSNNSAHYKSRIFDELLTQALKIYSEDMRANFYQKAEQQLDEDSAIIPVYHYVSTRLVKPYVGGYTDNLLNNIYVKDLYIKCEN